jgi:hypothetical protein
LPTSCNCDDWITFCEQDGEFCDGSKEFCTGWVLCGVDLDPAWVSKTASIRENPMRPL